MAEQIRTFIAIELEPAAVQALEQVEMMLKRERAARCVRWVEPRNIHLTLKFLGAVDAGKMSDLTKGVAGACSGVAPFALQLQSVGSFPDTRRPRVVWVGLAGETEVAARLAERIDEACAGLGFARETRAFAPHLTLGRVRRDVGAQDQRLVGEMIEKAVPGDLGTSRAERVSIMRSELRPGGSVYTRLAAVELAPPS